MLYLDASAIVKLVVEEDESDSVRRLLDGANTCTSLVARVEVPIAVARQLGEGAIATAERALHVLAVLDLTREIAARAARVTTLRALDAIHLATALSIQDQLEGFVTYDRRLAEAAASASLVVLAPS